METLPQRIQVFEYRSTRWLRHLFLLLVMAALLLVVERYRDVETGYFLLVGLLWVGLIASDALQVLRQAQRFVIDEKDLRIRWIRREELVSIPQVAVSENEVLGYPWRGLTLYYGTRTATAGSDLVMYEEFKAELLRRGAKERNENRVVVCGCSGEDSRVPLMFLLRDRTAADLQSAKVTMNRIMKGERVRIDALTARDARELRRELKALGAELEGEDTV